MKRIHYILSIVLTACSVNAWAIAESDMPANANRFWVGALLGYGDPDGNPTVGSRDGAFLPGVTLGTHLSPHFGIGADLNRWNVGEDVGPIEFDSTLYSIMPTAALVFNGLRVGAQAGIVIATDSSSIAGIEADDTETDFAFGPLVGLDFPIGRNLSLGAQATYTRVLAEDAFDIFGAQGALKVWF